ncbi:hypothetical protein DYD21_08425 [Rhodohalobacter sp. SW132]|uniref:hypothetical protein n=1 Tax=Rhodohalobacter sp. SW132 TaxID=2293433 RepID=UPI000E22A8C4|nr:hypothetical protein [Rhodohalobacter sp. SW132]REL37796.1 hypothetical protein DYD21_08425 [Rhodohalobacter sp. SW132]
MDYYANERWGLGKKILFRFACLYVLLYTLPEPYSAVPGISALGDYFNNFWNMVTVWFGTTILSLDGEINTQFMGSSDRLIDYLRVVVCLLITAAGTLIWSILDHRRLNYRKLIYWFRLHLRFFLFATLFVYGISKVIDSQFLYPNLWRFMQPLGEASPMGHAWSFTGFSGSYTFFIGMMEIIAALLLLFRKTTTLGAFIAVIVLTNVVALNFSYDIPVKQFSIHLLLFAVLLFSNDARRLMHILILNKPVTPVRYRKVFTDRWDRIGFSAIKIFFAGFIMFSSAMHAWQMNQQTGSEQEKPYLYGIWNVESNGSNGSDIPAYDNNPERWRYLIIDNNGDAHIITMNDNRIRFSAETDSVEAIMELNNGSEQYSFNLNHEGTSLMLTDEMDENSLTISMNRYDLHEFLLHSRDFNWIQEFPFDKQ